MTARLRSWTTRARAEESGASLVEYALMVALIAVVCIVSIAFVGTSADGKFETAYHGIKHGQPGPNSTRNVLASCGTDGKCTFKDSDFDPASDYDWEFPGGDYRVDEDNPEFAGSESSYLVYGYKYPEGTTHFHEDTEVMRVWCDRQSDGSYTCN